jgi:hydroxymethylpyrimidine/phosphomethylpyrimidine kinase
VFHVIYAEYRVIYAIRRVSCASRPVNYPFRPTISRSGVEIYPFGVENHGSGRVIYDFHAVADDCGAVIYGLIVVLYGFRPVFYGMNGVLHPNRYHLLMPERKKLPVALTIAGSDSGGGAGIQADLKTFAALGVHGTSAITCLTAQNPKRVLGIEVCSPKMLRQQIEAVFAELHPAAVKAGMLFSKENVSVVANFFENSKLKTQNLKLVVDPILVSNSGTRLLAPNALKIFREKLLPLATLATPNLAEAEILSGQKISSLEDMQTAAQKIQAQFGCAVLVKGGHLENSREATDVFFDGKNEFLLSAPFVKNIRTHGTGCTYSAAICAALALGKNLPQAVQIGKNFITAAISNGYKIGTHFALGQIKGSARAVGKIAPRSSRSAEDCSGRW